jgi:hypothetical protein
MLRGYNILPLTGLRCVLNVLVRHWTWVHFPNKWFLQILIHQSREVQNKIGNLLWNGSYQALVMSGDLIVARSQCCLKPKQGTFDQTKEDSSSEKKMVMASGGWTVSPLGQLGDVRTSPRAAKTRPMHHLWVHHLPHNNQNWGWLYSKSPHNFPCDPMIIPYSKKNSPRFRSMVILHKNPSAIFGRFPS